MQALAILFEGIHKRAAIHLEQAGYTVQHISGAAQTQDIISACQSAQIIGIRSRTQVNEKVLANANKLLAIGCFCIGYNQVDIQTAAQKAIAVFNAPHANTRSVAELVIGEIIMLMRRIPITNRCMHQGQWRKNSANRREIRGKTLGIIGYGNIGSQLSILAENMGMRVIFYDTNRKLALGNAKPIAKLNNVLTQSDVISLHVPQTQQTTNLITANELEKCKEGAIIINASRGKVVDINALNNALATGKIGGAAVDVFPEEPKDNEDTFASPLIGQNNVILTSHIGGSTIEAQASIGEEVAHKLINYIQTGNSSQSVNLPHLALLAPKRTRLLHVHRNVPGVLSATNSLIAKHNINIAQSQLATHGTIGYASLDIECAYGEEIALCEELNTIEETIRVRSIRPYQ